MKKRNGFVSNSSSSSFIIAVAEVEDIKKFRQYAQENDIKIEDNGGLPLSTFKELKERESNGWEMERLQEDKIIVESFDCSEVSISSKDMKDGTFVVSYAFYGNEGDGYFYDADDDDWGEPNYDRVYDDNFFDSKEEKMLTLFGDPEGAGLKKDNCESSIGAARNG